MRPLTDASPEQSALRCIREFFGEGFTGKLSYAGGTGPWVHKATVDFEDNGEVSLEVLPEQCESTPWEGKIFVFEADYLEVDPTAGHSAVHGDSSKMGWKTLRELITGRGKDKDYLCWLVIFVALAKLLYGDSHDTTPRYWEPRKYILG